MQLLPKTLNKKCMEMWKFHYCCFPISYYCQCFLVPSVLVLLVGTTILGGCSSTTRSINNKLCMPSERNALLNFKRSITCFNQTEVYYETTISCSDDDIFGTWEGWDCCSWSRVRCDNTTTHVTHLNLSPPDDYLYPFSLNDFHSSIKYLLELKQLRHLDLSGNDFNHYTTIPTSMGFMTQLRYLDLSSTNFSGTVPHQFGNLIHLRVLDLSFPLGLLSVDNFNWVFHLQKLRYLDMSTLTVSDSHAWMELLIGPLPSLNVLRLAGLGLEYEPTYRFTTFHNASHAAPPIHSLDLSSNNLEGGFPLVLRNLFSLEFLDLSYNNLTSKIPLWLGELQNLTELHLYNNKFTSVEGGLWALLQNLPTLKTLDASFNSLQGELLKPCGKFSNSTNFDLGTSLLPDKKKLGHPPSWSGTEFGSLVSLDLSDNMIAGEIPTFIGNVLFSLEFLDLSSNRLVGEIPMSLGRLSSLQVLSLFENHLNGTLSPLANLHSLTTLKIGNTSLTLQMQSNLMPLFELQEFDYYGCQVNGQLPHWLQTQNKLDILDLSNTNISNALPQWFANMHNFVYVNLSQNQIVGRPIFPLNSTREIDLSNNFLWGSLPDDLHIKMPHLTTLRLSNNKINGSIPKSLCQLAELELLDLHKNSLSGNIPDCFNNPSNLISIDLSSNMLSGHIPCFHDGLFTLLLHDNKLSGQIPSCHRKMRSLGFLDVGGNKLSGAIPSWYPNLQIMRLRDNNFNGNIPKELCSFPYLTLLDLGHNHFTGNIPNCVGSLAAMNSPGATGSLAAMNSTGATRVCNFYDRCQRTIVIQYNEEEVKVVIKGILLIYTSNLKYLVSIDLSCNNLVGNIPHGITNLSKLLNLNLSYNSLTGSIPYNIGALNAVESLDLSKNKLWGTIPRSMNALNSLGYLNLSFNNFSGQIPTGNHMTTLDDPLNYEGNPYLCGDRLPKKCTTDNEEPKHSRSDDDESEDKEDKLEKIWFYLIVMLGCATGFWGVVGTLILKRRWRHALFGGVEDVLDWIYVSIVLKVVKLTKK